MQTNSFVRNVEVPDLLSWSDLGGIATAGALVASAFSLLLILAQERTAARRGALREITTSELAAARDRIGGVAYSGQNQPIELLRRDSFLVLWAIQRMTSVPARALRRTSKRDRDLLQEHLHQLVKALGRSGTNKDPSGYRHAAKLAQPVVLRLATKETAELFRKAFPLVGD
jgi:hypothetical protein